MDNDNILTNQNQVGVTSKKKWKWSILWENIKRTLFAKADEEKRRNELDYFQYWYPEILEKDLQKQRQKENDFLENTDRE